MKYQLRFLLLLGFFSAFSLVNAQDIQHMRKNIKKLSSKEFKGRGYVDQGNQKAAKYIAGEFEKYALSPINKDWYQNFSFQINTFPHKVDLHLNGSRKLKTAYDFIIKSSAVSCKGEYSCLYLPLNTAQQKQDLSRVFLIGDKEFVSLKNDNKYQAKGFIYLQEKQPFWEVRSGIDTSSYLVLSVQNRAVKDSIKTIKLHIENEYIRHHTQNVWGLTVGTKYPDSMVLITAHYDHLGMLGEAMFPGANDNASGTAMMMELARYFAQNPLEYSLMFVAFSGEEAGLYGSRYMSNNFPFNLNQIKCQINLDMVATGSDGIKIVNGEQFPELFKQIVALNKKNGYVKEVKIRGESCNSDHCPFYEKGVDALFIYTLGTEATAYHIPQDDYKSVPLTEFEDLFRLLRDFLEQQ